MIGDEARGGQLADAMRCVVWVAVPRVVGTVAPLPQWGQAQYPRSAEIQANGRSGGLSGPCANGCEEWLPRVMRGVENADRTAERCAEGNAGEIRRARFPLRYSPVVVRVHGSCKRLS